MLALLLVAVEIVRLTPQAAEAARAEGEARAVAQFAREDAARAARREGRGFAGLGIGTRALSSAHAPLGDVGSSDFVYTPGSIGRNRYRSD